jgi:hypothetical protein
VSKKEQARPKARALPKIERDMQSSSVEKVRKRVGQTNEKEGLLYVLIMPICDSWFFCEISRI